MLRRMRTMFFVLAAAVLGAVVGRLAAQYRRRQEAAMAAGTDLEVTEHAPFDLRGVNLRVQDVVPGVVAALRVREKPWSYLHIPTWVAAFSVNFGVAALGRELAPLMKMADNFGLPGIDFGDDDEQPSDTWDAPSWREQAPSSAWRAREESTVSPSSPPPPPTSPPSYGRADGPGASAGAQTDPPPSEPTSYGTAERGPSFGGS